MNSVVIDSHRHRLLVVVAVFIALMVVISLLSFMTNRNYNIQTRNAYVKSSVDGKVSQYALSENDRRRRLLKQLENNLRAQMRLNLEAAGKSLEDDLKDKKFGTQGELITYLNKRIKELTIYSRTFNTEGDWFTVLTVGSEVTFLLDDSPDCGQPTYNGVPILNHTKRNRTRFDEVIWQDEAKLVLSKYGLIVKPKCIPDSKNLPDIEKKYKHDSHLENVEVITSNDIDYISRKYPDVLSTLRELRILMHYDYHKAENVMSFINFNKSTTYGDNLYWYFNEPDDDYYLFREDPNVNPDKEILEIYVIPSGVYGFFNEPKMKGAGIYNRNYVKVSLVAGCQLMDYLYTYKDTIYGYSDSIDYVDTNSKYIMKTIDKTTNDAVNFNLFSMILLSTFFCIAIYLVLYFYTREPSMLYKKEEKK